MLILIIIIMLLCLSQWNFILKIIPRSQSQDDMRKSSVVDQLLLLILEYFIHSLTDWYVFFVFCGHLTYFYVLNECQQATRNVMSIVTLFMGFMKIIQFQNRTLHSTLVLRAELSVKFRYIWKRFN